MDAIDTNSNVSYCPICNLISRIVDLFTTLTCHCRILDGIKACIQHSPACGLGDTCNASLWSQCAIPAYAARYLATRGILFLVIGPTVGIMTMVAMGSLKSEFSDNENEKSTLGQSPRSNSRSSSALIGRIWPLETLGIPVMSRLGIGPALDAAEAWMSKLTSSSAISLIKLACLSYGGRYFIMALLSRVDPEVSDPCCKKTYLDNLDPPPFNI